MQSKPLIGLNADFRNIQKDSPAFSYVCAGYYDCITAVGGIPIILPPLEEESDIEPVLDRLDAFREPESKVQQRQPEIEHGPTARLGAAQAPAKLRARWAKLVPAAARALQPPEFLAVAHRVREGLRAGHAYD